MSRFALLALLLALLSASASASTSTSWQVSGGFSPEWRSAVQRLEQALLQADASEMSPELAQVLLPLRQRWLEQSQGQEAFGFGSDRLAGEKPQQQQQQHDSLPANGLVFDDYLGATHDSRLVRSHLVHAHYDGDIPDPLDPKKFPVKCELWKTCDIFQICRLACKRGTVEVSPWLKHSLQTQWQLSYERPLNKILLYGTHNSAVSYADGYGVEDGVLTSLVKLLDPKTRFVSANQQLSLTDQMNAGVRQIELDVHWSFGDLRICHAGGVRIGIVNNLLKWISEQIGFAFDFDTRTLGCFSIQERTFADALSELHLWLNKPENHDQVLFIMLDCQMSLQEWDKLGILVQAIKQTFGDAVFTPVDKLEHFAETSWDTPVWPSPSQLVQMGKRIVFASGQDYEGNDIRSLVFYKLAKDLQRRVANWSEPNLESFHDFPDCTYDDAGVAGESGMIKRTLGDSIEYGPFLPAGKPDKQITEESLARLVRCNVNFPCADQMYPGLIEAGIWSWDVKQPSYLFDSGNSTDMCVAQQKSNGRWATVPCSQEYRFACQSLQDPTLWILSDDARPFTKSEQVCPDQFEFGVPADGYLNSHLALVLQDTQDAGDYVWINIAAPSL